jgi:tetratricopeptide (TPR) repeat protein
LLLARKLNPASGIIARDIAITYSELGKYHLAAHYAEEFGRLSPDDPASYGMRAEYYSYIGKVKEAIQYADRYLMLAKDNPALLCQIADVHVAVARYQVAFQFYNKALDQSADDYLSLVNKSKLLSSCPDTKVRDGGQAVKLALKAHEDIKIPKYSRWMSAIALAQAYAEVGNYEAAVRFAQQSIELAGPDFGRKDELSEKLSAFEKKMPYRIKPIR